MTHIHTRPATTSRRDWLRRAVASSAALRTGAGAGSLGLLAALTAAAQSQPDYKAVVCLFMFGGNDSNNTLIPTNTDADGHALYTRSRTSALALAREQVLPVNLQGTLGRTYGLHPAMTGMQQLINGGKASVITNVGTLVAPTTKAQYETGSPRPPNLFSHSDQQQEWQTGTPDGTMRTGWAGRLLEMQAAANGTNALYAALSVAGNTTLLNGNQSVAYKVSPSGNFSFDFYNPSNTQDPVSAGVAELLAAPREHLMEQTWQRTIERSIENQRVLQNALQGSNGTLTFPDNGLGRQMQMIARLIGARDRLGLKRQAFFASIGGFDTHGDDQLQRQNELLGSVSESVAAFQAAIDAMGLSQNVTLFTASDFNRNLRSNGQGSDHAWGGHHFVVGGAVRGGVMHGRFPNLTMGGPDDIGNGTFIPDLSVDQLGASVARWFGVADSDLNALFPLLSRFSSRTLPLFV